MKKNILRIRGLMALFGILLKRDILTQQQVYELKEVANKYNTKELKDYEAASEFIRIRKSIK